jgi:uncharacterized membrane protein YeiH
MSHLYIIDLLGTLVFAISGVLTAVQKKFDLVGATVVSFVTAVGGGTLRDIMIGETPVGWMQDANYLIIIFASLPLCFFFQKHILKLRKSIFLFDTIGIGLFTILGLQKTLGVGLSPAVAVMMGVVSAVFGGVIRDVLTNEVPLIFRKEIYAMACMAGALTYLLVEQFLDVPILNIWLSISVVIIIRIFAVLRKWHLPFEPR